LLDFNERLRELERLCELERLRKLEELDESLCKLCKDAKTFIDDNKQDLPQGIRNDFNVSSGVLVTNLGAACAAMHNFKAAAAKKTQNLSN
jgi:hypothetical protein